MSATPDVSLRPYSVPLDPPLGTATGTIERREGFLLRTEGEGVTGVGEAAPLAGWTESFRTCELALRRAREALAAGGRGAARDAVAGRPAAAHALDCATVDRRARQAGRPLYRYLGAETRRRSVPVNAVVGDADPAATATAAERAVADGVDCLKVKVGARELAADLERLRAVRAAVGAAVTLRADANGAWSTDQAASVWSTLGEAAIDLAYVEEPLGPEALTAHRELRHRPGPAVALDESVREHGVGAVLEAEAADVVVVKPMVLGGVERAATAVGRVRAAGLDPVVTTTVDAAVARTAAVHVAATIPDPRPCGLATAGRLTRDVAPDPAPVTDGRVAVPQDPGHGVTVEEVPGS